MDRIINKFRSPAITRAIVVFVVCLCSAALADFSATVDVKEKADFVKAMMKTLTSLREDGDSFASYSRRGDPPLGELVSIRTENEKTTVYVTVLHERSKDHGSKAAESDFVIEFPLKSRVENPVISYQQDAIKVTKLAKSAASISMICLCSREMETKKLTWATSVLRISFDREEQARDFLWALSDLLFDKEHGENESYVGLSKYPY